MFTQLQLTSVGKDLNQTIYKSRFESLLVSYDLNQSTENDLWLRFKSILKWYWLSDVKGVQNAKAEVEARTRVVIISGTAERNDCVSFRILQEYEICRMNLCCM